MVPYFTPALVNEWTKEKRGEEPCDFDAELVAAPRRHAATSLCATVHSHAFAATVSFRFQSSIGTALSAASNGKREQVEKEDATRNATAQGITQHARNHDDHAALHMFTAYKCITPHRR